MYCIVPIFTLTLRHEINIKGMNYSSLLARSIALSTITAMFPALHCYAADPSALTVSSSETPQTEVNDSVVGSTYDLDDIIIVTERPVVQSDGSKLTYNMEEDTSSKGMTLSDALRKVPMVNVDGEGNITINGQSNFKIFLNGKEEPSLSANYKTIFKAMPAEAVVKIEVITEPGAKYDAEGTGGILNLVTISKNSTDGYTANLSLSMMRLQSGASLYGRMKTGKLAISANIDYANGYIFRQKNNSESEVENLMSEDLKLVRNILKQRVGWNYISGNLNLSYDLTDSDLITADFSIMNMHGGLGKGSQTIYEAYNRTGNRTGFMLTDIDASITNSSLNAGAAWQHTFPHDARFILAYRYDTGANNMRYITYPSEYEGILISSPFMNTDNDGHNNEHTVQLDYINPFADNRHTLETGGKLIFRRNPAKSYSFQGMSHESAVETERTDLTQKQDVYAAYLAYTGRFGSFNANAGVRYEHTAMGIDFHLGDATDFLNYLNDVVPNVALTYLFSHSSNLRLSYQMRISRPSLDQVNPFRINYLPGVVECGNPDLESERSNKVTLTYTNFSSVIGGNVAIEYAEVGNAISRYQFTEGDDQITTYANIGHNRQIALSGFLNWNIMKGMQFSVNGRLAHIDLKSDFPALSNKGVSFNYGANWNYSLPSKLRFSAYGGQSTRRHTLQGWRSGWYYYGIGISKEFFSRNPLTASINLGNFLQSTTRYRSLTTTDSQISRTCYTNSNWNIGVSVSWTFGNLKDDVKKTSTSINNDDRNKGESKQGIM